MDKENMKAKYSIFMVDKVTLKDVSVTDESRYWIHITIGERDIRVVKANILYMEKQKGGQ